MSSDTKRLAALVRERRLALGLTVNQVVSRSGLKYYQIALLDCGRLKNIPKPEVLSRIGTVLGLSMDEMLRAAGYVAQGRFKPTTDYNLGGTEAIQ